MTRMNIAKAFLDFGGFAEKPAPTMESLMKQWKEEMDAATGGTWIPWDPSKEEVIAETSGASEPTGSINGEEAIQPPPNNDLDPLWEDVPSNVWLSEPQGVGEDGQDVIPKQQHYQRIAAEDDEHGESDGWEGLGAHPLQYPNRNTPRELPPHRQGASNDGNFSVTFSVTDEGPNESNSAGRKAIPNLNSRDSWDTWRTDPRPFRGGLGGDEPEWSKPGLPPKKEQQRAAMLTGSHSPRSRAWDLDKRGRKMKNREVIHGLNHIRSGQSNEVDKLSSGSAENQSDGQKVEGQDSITRASERVENERLVKERRDLKERLRAILDGTTI
jgi:hypothetical protein